MFRLGRFRSDPSVNDSADDDSPQNHPRTLPSKASISQGSMNSLGSSAGDSDVAIRTRPRPQLRTSYTSSSSFSSRPEGSGSGAAAPDPLGLQLVHKVDSSVGDIVFVHGLGGSAWRTWSWNRDPTLFWPDWLAEEGDVLANFGVWTFGYNAGFRGAATNLTILDFAKDLLLQLITALDDGQDRAADLNLQRPIIFVVHSMGGLVVKKAYTMGKHDDQYAGLVSRIKAILFLATPHRGSQYAKILNTILSTTPLATSSKAYIAGLDMQSDTIQDINEAFRQHSDGLLLYSFYENLKTTIGFTKAMIVDKSSAVLGYPSEMSVGMNADHHNVCKYKDRSDPNFRTVRGVLKRCALDCAPRTVPAPINITVPFAPEISSTLDAEQRIADVFGLRGIVDDTGAGTSTTGPGTSGSWLFERREFQSWLPGPGDETGCQQFLLVGLPGTGKTVLSRMTVNRLKSMGLNVQHHFFDRTNHLKRTRQFCFHSLAAQLALTNKLFRDEVLRLHDNTGISFDLRDSSMDFQTVWERFFEGILFQIRLENPIVWVLDSIDESDAPSLLLPRLTAIQSRSPIRIFTTSRPLKGLPSWDQTRTLTYFMRPSDTTEDMANYVTKAVQDSVPDDPVTQKFVRDEILSRATGSFLWARLALEIIQDSCHIKNDILAALTEVPKGMAAMYSRMMAVMEEQPPRNRNLAKRVLQWVACSVRALYVDEIAAALQPEFGEFVNLAVSLTQICGHFITVDRSEPGRPKVSLIHTTAREFLLHGGDDGKPPYIDAKKAHEYVALACLGYLSDDQWKRRFGAIPPTWGQAETSTGSERLAEIMREHALLEYAASQWAYHLSRSGVDSSALIEALESFLLNYCLSWIEGIALSQRMATLVRSAKSLKKFAKKSNRHFLLDPKQTMYNISAATSPVSPVTQDSLDWVQLWATDFIRIAGKFAANLVCSPSSVYRNIPPMCPAQSMIGKTFSGSMPPFARSDHLSVSGLSSETWDDCLASVVVGNDEFVNGVLATESYFFTLVSSAGCITAWSAHTCEKLRSFNHGEYVPVMAVGRAGNKLAASGFSSYSIWEVSTGRRLHRIPKTHDAIVRSLAFGPGETEIKAALDDCTIQSIDLELAKVEAVQLEGLGLDLGYQGSPWRQALSPDLTRVAMAWRGRTPIVEDLRSRGKQPLRCRSRGSSDPLMYPEQLVWHPDGSQLMILCNDTSLWEWRLSDDDILEHPNVRARDLAISEDGSLLLTIEHTGTISIWATPHLNLLYRLVNSGDPSAAAAFSPDSQRFYDVRGSICSAWEPDALVRSDDHDNEDATSTAGSSMLTEPVISAQLSPNSTITAIAMGPADKFFACAREDGSVIIHDSLDGGKRLRKVHSHPPSSEVCLLVWSTSGKYLASCDESGHLIVKKLQTKEEDKPAANEAGGRISGPYRAAEAGFKGRWAVFPALDCRLGEPARQLIFHPDEKLIWISTGRRERLWDLKSKKEVFASPPREGREQWHWRQHPMQPDRLLCFRGLEGHAVDWLSGRDLDVDAAAVQTGAGVEESSPLLSPDGGQGEPARHRSPSPHRFCRCKNVIWSATVSDGHHIILALSTADDPWAMTSHAGVELHLVNIQQSPRDVGAAAVTSPTLNRSSRDGQRINQPEIPAEICSRVRLLLGSRGSSLIFLGLDGWVFSYDTGSIGTMSATRGGGGTSGKTNPRSDLDLVGLRRHFFLPRDWLNTTTAHMACVGAGGDATFFCPKQGEVAIVKNGLRF
ncbi:NACHT and WD domain-containing protein [Gaeumannomyces tritici R3-111a-1]|uniref:NACHT and WD domain-containing protein n=1 Tax=Gaeumannomyces tritici (strain R3-111a-1) TaxID=644352 RepID=J3NH53_GAET3|nr:NACHT and WD domain-containing protein [Gaeumannomyces tritici R3-111a-1]EJT80596.1 NACHT and WD domain-containing protein [Gaeumannomyces tritici R3-111a-1]